MKSTCGACIIEVRSLLPAEPIGDLMPDGRAIATPIARLSQMPTRRWRRAAGSCPVRACWRQGQKTSDAPIGAERANATSRMARSLLAANGRGPSDADGGSRLGSPGRACCDNHASGRGTAFGGQRPAMAAKAATHLHQGER